MKISDLQEAIKGWKHAGTDLTRMRTARAAEQHEAKLVSVKKDGTESRMHDAVSTYATEAQARAKHAALVKMNPHRNIRHNLYVNGKLMQMLDSTTLTEISHKVGAAAGRALAAKSVTADQQQKHMQKFQELTDKEQELSNRPDSHTGKYAKEFINLSRQKTKVARAGGLNAFGKPMMEDASSGSTASGSIASVANPISAVMRRPSLFGYVPAKTKRKSTKSK